METIKSYLEAMFAAMPNTAEVRKAKAELLQMMEDKYNELIANGQNENTAVGTVISEFGNLDELAEGLGLVKVVEETRTRESETPRRNVGIDEVKGFIENRRKKALLLALGVFFCIVSVACPILFGERYGAVSVLLMFICIALGVGFIVYSSYVDSSWKFLKTELCRIDMATADYVKEKLRSFEPVRALCVTIGVILFIICWVPNMFYVSGSYFAPALMFVLIGLGVLLIIYSSKIRSGYEILMQLNDVNTISGTYINQNVKPVRYKNKTAQTIVEIYWPVATCLYLILSFLTFRWDITWIIWLVAGIMHRAVVINCRADEI
ncbi:MAG: permease prefix domain 1-containing protein [Lachnospiraceae bacterium]|nr:permease prefix domain 1-containing protein [Lachnospiraceae bacterium]